MIPTVLFILKRHEGSGGYLHSSSGLRNSATFVADMLNDQGLANASVVIVIDGNDIDREVFNNRPDVVILEAIWCPPSKLAELVKLWPKVIWTVRVHSEIPFLAMEGQAIEWIAAYTKIPNVFVSSNSGRANRDLAIFRSKFLPNFFPQQEREPHEADMENFKVGCFGAIRPLKNQLIQAFAAVEYTMQCDIKRLTFYVNSTRAEQGGENVLKNLRALFAYLPAGFTLAEGNWCERDDFLELVASMTVCMCVSLSESFCIVAADCVSEMVPIVVSPEVSWADRRSMANPTSSADIVQKLHNVLGWERKWILHENREGLQRYNRESIESWSQFLES